MSQEDTGPPAHSPRGLGSARRPSDGVPESPLSPDGVERSAGRRARTRQWFPWVAAVAFLLVAVVGVLFAWRWWTHPDVLSDVGGNVGGSAHAAGTPWTFGVTFPHSGHGQTITFTGRPVPRFATDSADTTVSFSICRLRARQSPIGAEVGDLHRWCSRVTPVADGVTFTYPSPREYLIVTVTPTRPGTARITAADFSYRTGKSDWFRRGTERITMGVTVRTQPH